MEKAGVEEKSSEGSEKMITGGASAPSSSSSSDQIQESLKILSEETLQLSELLWQEEKLVKELCVLLKLVLRQLNISFNLPLNILTPTERVQRIILNDEAHLILINDKNEVRSKALEDCAPAVIFDVVSFVIPELSKSFVLYRKRISSRINLFERVNQELRNVRNIFAHSQKSDEDGGPNDGVKKALLPQKKDSGEEGNKGSA